MAFLTGCRVSTDDISNAIGRIRRQNISTRVGRSKAGEREKQTQTNLRLARMEQQVGCIEFCTMKLCNVQDASNFGVLQRLYFVLVSLPRAKDRNHWNATPTGREAKLPLLALLGVTILPLKPHPLVMADIFRQVTLVLSHAYLV